MPGAVTPVVYCTYEQFIQWLAKMQDKGGSLSPTVGHHNLLTHSRTQVQHRTRHWQEIDDIDKGQIK